MSNERVLEKVRKLLAMANDERGNEQERENALRQATKLMAHHQIEMADVPSAQRDKDDPVGRFDMEGWYIPWVNMTRGSVARLFSCKYFQGGKVNATRGRHVFVGRASNATTAMLMADWVVREALREADRVGGHRLNPAGRSFGLGFADRLAARVTALLAESAEEVRASTGRDLVVVRADHAAENEAWIEANMKVGKAKSLVKRKLDSAAYYAGRDSADKVNLSKQIKTEEQSALPKM